jgi:hypothetical protein
MKCFLLLSNEVQFVLIAAQQVRGACGESLYMLYVKELL